MRIGIACVAAVLGVAALVHAQEAEWRWDPAATRVPQVGERTFDDYDDVQERKTVVEMPTRPVDEHGERVVLSVRYVTEVLAVESATVARSRVTVERWQRKADDVTDACLEGAVVVVDGPPDRRRAELEKARALTPAAKAWVQSELARPLRTTADPLDPPAPVTSGSEWTIEPVRFAKALFPGFDVDEAASTARGRLGDVRVVDGRHVGKLDWKVALKLKTFPGSEAVPFAEGGLFKVSYEGESCLEPGLRNHGTLAMKIDLSGTAERPLPDGKKLRVSIELHFDKKARKGALP